VRAWWSDTLFKRLVLLMWLGLVASQLLAFAAVTRGSSLHSDGAGGLAIPLMPSLPPIGAAPQRDGHPGPSPLLLSPGPNGDFGARAVSQPELSSFGPMPNRGPAASALWMDYAIRFLAIGLAAWFGARWLTAPMRRLAAASEDVGRTLEYSQHVPPLDEHAGTMEMRQTAVVFNAMAQRLHAQFEAQRLLMAAISHDLRTPLTRLRMRMEMMQTEPKLDRCIADVHEMDDLIGSVRICFAPIARKPNPHVSTSWRWCSRWWTTWRSNACRRSSQKRARIRPPPLCWPSQRHSVG